MGMKFKLTDYFDVLEYSLVNMKKLEESASRDLMDRKYFSYHSFAFCQICATLRHVLIHNNDDTDEIKIVNFFGRTRGPWDTPTQKAVHIANMEKHEIESNHTASLTIFPGTLTLSTTASEPAEQPMAKSISELKLSPIYELGDVRISKLLQEAYDELKEFCKENNYF